MLPPPPEGHGRMFVQRDAGGPGIMIDGTTKIFVVHCRCNKYVRLRIESPKEVKILRCELDGDSDAGR